MSNVVSKNGRISDEDFLTRELTEADWKTLFDLPLKAASQKGLMRLKQKGNEYCRASQIWFDSKSPYGQFNLLNKDVAKAGFRLRIEPTEDPVGWPNCRICMWKIRTSSPAPSPS